MFFKKPTDKEKEKEPLLVNSEEAAPRTADDVAVQAELPDLPRRKNSDFTFLNNVTFFEVYLLFIGALASLVQGLMPLGFYFYFGKLVSLSRGRLCCLVKLNCF